MDTMPFVWPTNVLSMFRIPTLNGEMVNVGCSVVDSVIPFTGVGSAITLVMKTEKNVSLVCSISENAELNPNVKLAGITGTTKLVLICQSSKVKRPVTGTRVLLVKSPYSMPARAVLSLST